MRVRSSAFCLGSLGWTDGSRRWGSSIAAASGAALTLAIASAALAGCRASDGERVGRTTRTSAARERASASPDAQVSLTSAEQPRGGGVRESVALPAERSTGSFEVVKRFDGPTPTGVTVSKGGRIFVNFPRWGDPVEYTVAELRNGVPIAFPDADTNRWPPKDAPADRAAASRALVSVQSVVVDPKDRLWIVDSGAPHMKPIVDGAPKLMAVELATNRIVDTIPIPADVALRTSYLNDVRFDLRRGAAGYAFVTDSSSTGPNAIIVIDLATKKAVRRLNDHPSTKAEKGFVPFVEGKQLRRWAPGQAPEPFSVGVDGIAIAADGSRLFYSPLASRHLYSVSVDALVDFTKPDSAVAATVQDLGDKGASDGLESDAQGRVYVTDYENNAIKRTRGDGVFETLLSDPRVLWPDTMALADDGYLYVIVNQLHRQARFHDGADERARPFLLLRTRTDGTPVALAR
jgi:sugar lactone lactonase YvrE